MTTTKKAAVDPEYEAQVLKNSGVRVGDKVKWGSRSGTITAIDTTEGKCPMVEYWYTNTKGERRGSGEGEGERGARVCARARGRRPRNNNVRTPPPPQLCTTTGERKEGRNRPSLVLEEDPNVTTEG